jgi:Tol biopolymer transport system component
MVPSSLLALTLTLLAQHGVMYHYPRWSPDGNTIVVSAMAGEDPEIWLLRLDGGPPLQLTDNTALDDGAEWLEGGRRIVFTTDRRGGRELFSMAPDGSDQTPFDGTLPPSRNPRTGAILVESIQESRSTIVAVYPDQSRRVLTTGPDAEQASFSPSGEHIVYEQRSPTAPDDVARSNVMVADADGSNARIVSSGTDPSWSPDGKTLLFKIWVDEVSAPMGGRTWIATASVDGKSIRRLAPGVHPHWSPDGRRITFMADSAERTDVWVMDADGGGQTCLTCGY